MSDLRPYVCTVKDCYEADKQFSTVRDYLKHEVVNHELQGPFTLNLFTRSMGEASIKCLFCGLQTEVGTGPDSRAGHVGRHMEEIAFVVVPKAYEDWDFYSDSSSISSGIGVSKEPTSSSTIPGTVVPPAGAEWARPQVCDFCHRGVIHQIWPCCFIKDKPFVCNACLQTFDKAGFFGGHLQVHQAQTAKHMAETHRCDLINPSTKNPCNTVFSRLNDLTHHEYTIHNRKREKLKCH